jgi:allantoinase
MNYEEGSEYSMMDSDGVSDAALTETASTSVPRGERDLAAESMFEYGSRVGFWRLHRIFQERELPMTVYACALALERNPPAVKRSKRRNTISVVMAGAGWNTSSSMKRPNASTSERRSRV